MWLMYVSYQSQTEKMVILLVNHFVQYCWLLCNQNCGSHIASPTPFYATDLIDLTPCGSHYVDTGHIRTVEETMGSFHLPYSQFRGFIGPLNWKNFSSLIKYGIVKAALSGSFYRIEWHYVHFMYFLLWLICLFVCWSSSTTVVHFLNSVQFWDYMWCHFC